MNRSYLFAPGHNEKLLGRVFDAGADAVMLDLEDSVPPDAKQRARAMAADVLGGRAAWVRINAVGTELAAADLEAIDPHTDQAPRGSPSPGLTRCPGRPKPVQDDQRVSVLNSARRRLSWW